MKCRACDCFLNDFESVKKNTRTGEYLDLCNACETDVEELMIDYYDDNVTEEELGDGFDC